MKTIDILQEQWQAPAASLAAQAASLAAHAALGAGLYFGDKKSKEKPPTPLEKPAGPVKPEDSVGDGEEIITTKQDVASTSKDKSVNGKLFHDRLKAIAKDLGVDRSNLLRIMEMESGMDPAARNKKSGARGLIQFMPKTALGTFGKTADWIATLTAYDQLLYVWNFYRLNKLPRGANLGDMYIVTFMPAALGKPDDFALGKKNAYGKKAWDVDMGENWDQNDLFAAEAERNGRDYFTVGDVKKVIQTKH